MAGIYDSYLSKAKSQAKAHWGAGWANLTPDMKAAFTCRYLAGTLGGIDVESAFGEGSTDLEKKLIGRLRDIVQVLAASQHEE